MSTIGRLKDGDMLLTEEVNERLPAVTSGLIAHFPFDYTAEGMITGGLYKDSKTWHTTDYVPAKRYPLTSPGDYPTVVLEADVYLESVPSERFTVLETPIPQGAIYLSIDSNMKVNAYNHAKVSNGYHASKATLKLHTWHRVTHINTSTETIIMVDGVVDTAFNNAYDAGITEMSISETFIGAENTGRHLQGQIKNIKVGCVDPRPSTNINTSFTPDGIAIDEGTTNLISYDADPTGVGYDATAEESREYVVAGTRSFKMLNVDPVDLTYRGWRFNMETGKRYVGSFYIYDPHNVIYQAQLHDNVSEFASKVNTVEDYGNGYKRFVCKGTAARTAQSSHGMIFYFQTGNTNPVWVSGVQIEQKEFSTAPANGTRGSSSLALSNTVPLTGDYTVSFKIKNNTVVGNAQSYASVMSMGNYHSNNSWTIMDSGSPSVNGRLGFIRRGNAGEWGWATTSVTSSSDLGKYITITITRDTTNYKCYNNGVLKGTIAHMSTTMQDILWVGSRQSGSQTDSADFKDLSVYNRALSEDEVKKLVGVSMSIKKDGGLFNEILEAPLALPAGANYFPLAMNASSSQVAPVSETNIIYEDSSAWVSNAVTNVYNGAAEFTSFSVVDGNNTLTANDYDQRMRGNKIVKITKTALAPAGHASYRRCMTVSASSTYTVSFKVKILKGDISSIGFHFSGGTSGGTPVESLGGGWYKFAKTATSPGESSAGSGTSGLCVGIGFVGTPAVECLVTEPQLEKADFASPFVDGTRGQGRIEFPTSLVSGKEFAFAMWARSDGFNNEYNMPFDCYPHLYVAMRKGKYLHFSFHNNGTQVSLTGGTLVTGKWHHIAGIKTATSVSMFLDGKLVASHTVSGTGYSTSPSRFSIGSYGGSYPLNGYIRDLIIESGSITLDAAKIEALYKTQMRGLKNGRLHIQGQIREGKVL